MSTTPSTSAHPAHGQIAYLQIPTTDLERSIGFYREVLGWNGDATWAGFDGPGIIGQWVTDRAPAPADAGPVLWLAVERIHTALHRVTANGGTVVERPTHDQGERLLATVRDPSGNTLGLFQALVPARPQPLLTVRDVEAASAWYQRLFGFESDHGGPEYERLLSRGQLVLQLHRWDVEHHHGHALGSPDVAAGNGAALWIEVDDFDEVVERAGELGATIELGGAPVRNPPEGEPGGPAHRELWLRDLDGYLVVAASPDFESPLA
ncbi:MAG: VOC family protein [Acidimicrobiales bacterium]